MYVAIDIGGTKTDVGFYKTKDLHSLTTTTSFLTEQNFQKGKNLLIAAIREKSNTEHIEGLGISFPGIVGKAGDILQASNIPDYKGKPLKSDLAHEFSTEVVITQDSLCSAVAELMYGNIRGYSRVVHLILGTGLGGTFLEIGADRVIASPIEPCGLIVDVQRGRMHEFNKTKGLLEAYVGGGSIEAHYAVGLATVADDNHIWEELTDYLAVGINNLNCILKPEMVIIGGGIGCKRQNALKSVVEKVTLYTEFVEPPQVEFTRVEGNSSLIGALAVNFVPNLILHN